MTTRTKTSREVCATSHRQGMDWSPFFNVSVAYGDFRIPYRGIKAAPIPKSLVFHQDPPSSFLRDNFLTMRLEMRVRGRESEQWKVVVDETATTVCNVNPILTLFGRVILGDAVENSISAGVESTRRPVECIRCGKLQNVGSLTHHLHPLISLFCCSQENDSHS